MILNVVTAVTRPGNLARIQASLEAVRVCAVRWFVAFDTKKVISPPRVPCYWQGSCPGTLGGGEPKTLGTHAVEAGWVYVLDDDNIMHPGLAGALLRAVESHPEARGFVFAQVHADGNLYRRAELRNIDQGQFVLDRALIGESHYRSAIYESDSISFASSWPKHRMALFSSTSP
jgi:hypothetical protein